MAGGGSIGPGNGKKYPDGITCNIFWTCGLIFRYDLGISGGVTSIPIFLEKILQVVYRKEEGITSTNQYYKYNSQILTLFTSSLYLAALVACLFASWMTRKWGRKKSMFLGGFLFLDGAIINVVAQNIPITIGILVADVTNYFFAKLEWSWCVSLGCAVVPALIFIIGSWSLPDTPNSLIERRNHEKAKNRLQKYHEKHVDIEEEFNDLVSACEETKKIKNPWINIFRIKYRPQLTFAFLLPAFQKLTEMNVYMFYAPVLFRTIGFGMSAYLMSTFDYS
ncbi:Sugar carrier protein C-like [Heracleum sosnowskyi]|uniref:Sugar carrier protein C-like n=1 Tax=Heracleum sosnowskyi TaxID=360622 RepID=A0AAD8JIU9_9APIA|nr:Sugar carrier protein C-like [Heracleum sosnowskyi]